MMDPITFAGGVVLELAGSAVFKRIIKDIAVKNALNKSLAAAYTDYQNTDYKQEGHGSIDYSLFLIHDIVKDELWAKLLRVGIDDNIDYNRLALALKDIWGEDLEVGETEIEAIEYFVYRLKTHLWTHSILHSILNTRVIKQLDTQITAYERRMLIQDYLEREKAEIGAHQQSDIGEGNQFIEPLIEKEVKRERRRPERMDETDEEEEKEHFESIDMGYYFTNGSDTKMLVIADSGYGKSTLLRELFLRTANNCQRNGFIPVFWLPTELAHCHADNIEQILEKELNDPKINPAKIQRFVQESFNRGEYIFFLDALDQVPDREKFIGCLQGRAFGNNRVVVTTRPNIWDNADTHGFATLQIRKFDEIQWSKYLGEKRLAMLKDVVDDEFLSIPILLRLITRHWLPKEGKIEPIKNRAELYKRVFDDLLKREEDKLAVQAEKKSARRTPDLRDDLRRLAHHTLVKNYLGQFPRDETKKLLGEDHIAELECRQGVVEILESGEQMAFRHRSFQEYLAAEFLKLKTDGTMANLKKLQPYLFHPNWENSIVFLAALLDNDLAEKMLNMIFHPSKELALVIYYDHLRLGALCLKEKGHSCIKQRSFLHRQLSRAIKDKAHMDIAISILGLLGDSVSIRQLLELLHDPDYYVRVRATKALGNIKDPEAIKPLIEGLHDPTDSIRRRSAEALGKFKDPAAIKPLVEALHDINASVRRRAAEALGNIKDPETIKPLIEALYDTNQIVRSRAAAALGNIKDPMATKPLLPILKDTHSSVRWRAAEALGKIKDPEAIKPLIEALNDINSYVRGRVAYALSNISSPAAINPLITAVHNTDNNVRLPAIFALGKIKDPEAIKPLIEALHDTDDIVRGRAAYALGKIKDTTAIGPLIATLHDPQAHVRGDAADALGRIKDPAAIKPLIATLQEAHASVRGRAARALGNIKTPEAVKPLIDALHDPDAYVRRRAAYALGNINNPEAIKPLLATLDDTDTFVRRYAAEALSNIKDPAAIKPLIEALHDTNVYVRSHATKALRNFKDRVVIEALIEALHDINASVRGCAAAALENINDHAGTRALIEALGDANAEVRGRAAEALGRIKASAAIKPLIAALHDPEAHFRGRAAEALGKINHPAAIVPLIKAIHDTAASARWPAVFALENIKARGKMARLISEFKKTRKTSIRASFIEAIRMSDRAERAEKKIKPAFR
ncbi:MAG: HEAT repeat domain-containing protein [candidate division Zixibacteria bacterium]|nr:HEAT repeat domain-containing protein [candidate division Zixibacteria bacterium]